MTINEVFWGFLILSALQPIVRQKWLEASRLRVLARLGRARGSLVVSLVHRQETLSFLGFPLMRYIDVNDAEDILRAIRLCEPEKPIDLIVHTPGGLVLAADQIAHALHRHPGRVTVFVPHYAMSGGTLIALAADQIVMDPNAVLGPVDPQIGQSPAASILSVLDRKPPKEIDDQTLILADVAAKAIAQLGISVRTLLSRHMASDAAEKLAEKLTRGGWTHDYAIGADEAKGFGLPVSTDIPADVHEFLSLFPQPTRTRPSVEYIPLPQRSTPRRE